MVCNVPMARSLGKLTEEHYQSVERFGSRSEDNTANKVKSHGLRISDLDSHESIFFLQCDIYVSSRFCLKRISTVTGMEKRWPFCRPSW